MLTHEVAELLDDRSAVVEVDSNDSQVPEENEVPEEHEEPGNNEELVQEAATRVMALAKPAEQKVAAAVVGAQESSCRRCGEVSVGRHCAEESGVEGCGEGKSRATERCKIIAVFNLQKKPSN